MKNTILPIKLILFEFIILILLLVTPFTIIQSQTSKPSFDKLKQTEWKIVHGWFGDSIVTLKALENIPPSDTAGLSADKKELQLIFWEIKQTSGQKIIHFDSSGDFHFTYYLYCPVGENVFNVRTFELREDKFFVEFRKHYWLDKDSEYKNAVYSIDKWTSEEIVLVKK